MSITSKYKWIVSLILGGSLLVLAMMGGKWQTTFAADTGINADPVIYSLNPNEVKTGSGNVLMVISGANFGYVEDFIRVWIKDATHDYSVAPMNVIDTGISVIITDTLLVDPNIYTIRVIKSNGLSVPPIPPDPEFDKVSNPMNFTVCEDKYMYLPIILK